jgi:hypothetical protein
MPKMVRLVWVLALILPLASAVARGDTVLDWNTVAVNTAVANKANPFAQGRYAAIVQLAVFEGVNSITGEYQPYLGTITSRPQASPEAAAVEAAYKVLSYYFGLNNQTTQSALDAARMSSLSGIPDGQAKTDGIQAGDDAAQA